MAKKNESAVVAETRYKGSQLLKVEEFDNRIGRIVLNPDEFYSFDEARELMKNYL